MAKRKTYTSSAKARLTAAQRHAQRGMESDKRQHPGLTRLKIKLAEVVPQLPSPAAQTGYADEHEAQRAALYALVTDAAPGVDVSGAAFGVLDASCDVLASEAQAQALRDRFGVESVTPYWCV